MENEKIISKDKIEINSLIQEHVSSLNKLLIEAHFKGLETDLKIDTTLVGKIDAIDSFYAKQIILSILIRL